MKTLQQQLGNYGLYHRSKRNVLTHFFGIPLIVFAVICLLARIHIPLGEFVINAAQIVVFVSVVYYLMLSVSLGLIMAILLVLFSIAAAPIAQLIFSHWLQISAGLFVFGWVLQFIGHYYEGKKPAFIDDIVGLVIGPLFVLAELLFMLGFYKTLEHEVTEIAGPTKP
ncbi:DUF962 domain-containing protein [Pseudoalteromonas ostreae]|uniref:Mpo1 family 2-hydroxy fatty acid dioxygenase n=1 Tax=Pseudoalteromonas ostreae TaxID=2774154 RepID=UPI001B3740C8|nr:Mpo1-like protein [Pseudoalteromonas ostreae]